MHRPSPGRPRSKPVFWRFSTRKYSLPPVPSFHSRYSEWLVSTCWIVTLLFVVTVATFTQPWLALHHAEGCAGVSPPPFQLPPAIRHQLPRPADE